MASYAALTDPIVRTGRPDLQEAIRSVLKDLGGSNMLAPPDAAGCVEFLVKNPHSILVLDWGVGPAEVNQILAAIKGHFLVETRPVMLIIPEIDTKIVATGAEYGVSQIHAGEVSRDSLRACITALLQEDHTVRETRAMLVQVATAREKGDWTVATPILLELHDKYPDNDRVASELAENLIHEGAWEHAASVLTKFAQSNPPYIRALHLLGRCALALGDHDAAIGHLQKAKLFNPHNVDRLVDLGHAFLSADRLEEARANFDAAARLDPEHKGALSGQGQCLLMAGEVNEALALLKDISGPRELASLFNTSAVLAMRQGRFDQGMALYKSAMGAIGKDEKIASRLFYNMGIGFKRWGKPDKAMACFDRSLELDPTYVKAAKQKDQVLRTQGARPLAPQSGSTGAGLPAAGDEFEEERVTRSSKQASQPKAAGGRTGTDDFDVDQ